MARSLSDFRGAYSELESGRCMVTPTHSTDYQGGGQKQANTKVHAPIHINRSRRGDDLQHTDVHTSQSIADNDDELNDREFTERQEKTTTVESLRSCIGNWVCLLFGFLVLAGSIAMTVFGFLASEFSQKTSSVDNVTTEVRDKELFETLTSLKTYGPIMIGCAVFIIMCACVLLCDARDRLNKVVEPEDARKEATTLYYTEVLRRIYDDEMRQKDLEETRRRTKKIDEYFEYMSRYPIGRRTLIRALRPRSFSDPCVRLDTAFPDAYEYARERLTNNPLQQPFCDENLNPNLIVDSSPNLPTQESAKRELPAPLDAKEALFPPVQRSCEKKPTTLGTLPPISSRSNNGPIKVDEDTTSLPVGSLEKLYLGDDVIIGGTRKKQKKKNGKRKKKKTSSKVPQGGDKALPVLTLLDTSQTNADGETISKLESAQEARNSSLQYAAKDKLEQGKKEQIDGSHLAEVQKTYHGVDSSDLTAGSASAYDRGKIITVASVTNELEPEARTHQWVTENRGQSWKRRAWADGEGAARSNDSDFIDADDPNINLRKSSTDSLSFEGPKTLSLRHQAMVL
ncbi:hypothetical protein HOLleu_22799 [Holothuria leucospilota]|uniref:Transmembrane protein n=1 Tax=Holothuria leucospilota TaxID=206669 RepID=A0A9Q1H2G4_HOLLE|nr:hypothetical protein HOLleu_22799 [Holothuria leucospilota]